MESNYFKELCRAMGWLAKQPNTLFVGQGVGCAGTTLTDTLAEVPQQQLLEFPVAEDLQMGSCIGMALDGILPVCIFPRWNFLLCTANQIVNHLDRLPILGNGYNPRVIIRVATPVTRFTAGFDPGPQHDDDFTHAFRAMLRRIKIVTLKTPDEIMPAYQGAAAAPHSTLLVEYTALYGAVPSGVKG
jgi:pyruvate/2-oxoglutarate/acetoin dehydrogenase E1 component